jgi:hypothetical protein
VVMVVDASIGGDGCQSQGEQREDMGDVEAREAPGSTPQAGVGAPHCATCTTPAPTMVVTWPLDPTRLWQVRYEGPHCRQHVASRQQDHGDGGDGGGRGEGRRQA